MQEKVAVVVSTCNRAEYLLRAVRSVTKQTYPHWRCYVIGDHCVDDSGRRLLLEFSDFGDQVYFKNLGFNTGKRRNRTGVVPKDVGVLDSTEPLIAFLDDDNEWLPEHLETLVTSYSASSQSKIGLVYSDMSYWRIEQGETVFKRRLSSRSPPQESYIDTSIMMVTREAIDAAGGWTKSYKSRLEFGEDEVIKRTDDWHLARRIMENGFNWVHVPVVTVKYYLKCLPEE